MEEGWGLTHDSEHLYASDGTSRLFEIDPKKFEVLRVIDIKDKQGKEVRYVNELELVGEHIYGNVLPLNVIVKIDKNTGIIEKVWDFKKLFEMQMHVVKQ